MSQLPTGVSYKTLDSLVNLVSELNKPLDVAAQEMDLDLAVLVRNKASYWYMFDNMHRIDAQLLWVLAQKVNEERLSSLSKF